jgi:hypothetical protein
LQPSPDTRFAVVAALVRIASAVAAGGGLHATRGVNRCSTLFPLRSLAARTAVTPPAAGQRSATVAS